MPESFNVEVVFSGANRISGAAGSVTQDLNRVTRSVSDTNREMGALERNMQRVRSALDLGIAGAMVSRVVNFAEEFNQLGTEVNAARETFVALSGGSEQAARGLQLMRQESGGIVDDLTLMRSANQLLLTGLADTHEQAARLTTTAVRLGGALGRDAAASIENLNAALLNNSFVRLDTLGISAAAVRERVQELTAAGMDMSAAFAQATMEEGEQAILALGDAATVAETPLRRLQTGFDNIVQTLAGNFTTGLNATIGLLQALGDASNRNWEESQRWIARELAIDAVLEQMRTDQVPGMHSGLEQRDIENSAEMRAIIGQALDAAAQQQAAVQGILDAVAAGRAAALADEQLMGSLLDRQNERRREAARAQNALNVLQERAFDTQIQQVMAFENLAAFQFGAGRGVVGGQQLFSQDELNAALQWEQTVQRAAEQLEAQRAAGAIISPEDIARAQQLAENAGIMVDNIQAGVDAFANMTLPQALGVDGGDPLLSDINAALLQELSDRGILDVDAMQAAADTFHLASGETTQAALSMRDNVIPTLAQITERLGAAEGAQRAAQVENMLRNLALGGQSNNLFAPLLTELSTGTLGGIDFQTMLDPFVQGWEDARNRIMDTNTEAGGIEGALQPGEQALGRMVDATDTLESNLKRIADHEWDIRINVTVNDPSGALSAAQGGVINVNAGGSGGNVTRNNVDMRGRGTTSGGLRSNPR